MALANREAALIAASKVTTQQVKAVADTYETWINSKITAATAVLALLEASGQSKSPARVTAIADVVYARIENDPTTETSVTPNTGLAAGGTAVVIVGTNFTGATGVTFGGSAGTAFSVVDDSHIHVTTPSHSAGAVNVVVVNPVSGNATLTNGFTYS